MIIPALPAAASPPIAATVLIQIVAQQYDDFHGDWNYTIFPAAHQWTEKPPP
jgi:hypothetical protein